MTALPLSVSSGSTGSAPDGPERSGAWIVTFIVYTLLMFRQGT